MSDKRNDLMKRLGIPETRPAATAKNVESRDSEVLEMPLVNEVLPEDDLEDESKPYIQRRVRGQEVSLELVKLDGSRRTPEYAYLMDKLIDRDGEEITLIFTTCTVMIRGRNLLPLFRCVKDHIAALVREQNPAYDLSPEPITFINEIAIKDKTGEGF